MSGAEIGVFGGSGFYSLLDDVTEIKVDTPYGPPSDSVMLASVGGKRVAFLPRHGRMHTIPPHMINYRANVWAFHSLGVKAVVSPCACGSLQERIAPGSFLVTDQFVDRTKGRPETFYDGPITTHVSDADIVGASIFYPTFNDFQGHSHIDGADVNAQDINSLVHKPTFPR